MKIQQLWNRVHYFCLPFHPFFIAYCLNPAYCNSESNDSNCTHRNGLNIRFNFIIYSSFLVAPVHDDQSTPTQQLFIIFFLSSRDEWTEKRKRCPMEHNTIHFSAWHFEHGLYLISLSSCQMAVDFFGYL